MSKINKLANERRKNKKTKRLLAQAEANEKDTEAAIQPAAVIPPSTLSIAIPGSILENAQSLELRSYLAGQIARAGCVFQVDEIVVFDDSGDDTPSKKAKMESDDGTEITVKQSCAQLARILQYLECPQYLRKFFFPLHRDLKFSGLLNPLDAPHHLRQNSQFEFREGVVSPKVSKSGRGCFVNVGLLNDVFVDNQTLEPGIRVTCRLNDFINANGRKVKAEIVAPSQPRKETGVYWGYSVRLAKSLSQVLTQCPYDEGYDLTIGTSDRGRNIYEVEEKSVNYNHALVVFGGLLGLEFALENDHQLDVEDPEVLFDHYFNTIPHQGSRTIRTEEAILISLACLRPKLNPTAVPKPFLLADAIPQSADTGRITRHPYKPKYNSS